MSKNVTKLTEAENNFFHINYDYMWKKLNTAPYYVCGSGECPEWVKGTQFLPSYVNLSKCRNHDFVPSTTIVNKIIQFFNANLSPEVSVFQFLSEDLSLTDGDRRPAASKFDDRFLGTYYGYYYSTSEKKTVVGAIIKIYAENQTLRASVITGIANESQLYSQEIKEISTKTHITERNYEKYKSGLDIAHQRTTLYDGPVILTDRFLFIQLQGVDKKHKNLAITLNLEGFNEKTPYICGLSFSVLISDKFDIECFMFAISRAYTKSLVPIHFDNEELHNILDIKKGINERIILTPRDEQRWYELVTENGK